MTHQKIAIVHTSFAVLDLINGLFDEIIPDVQRVHIIEHSILQDILDAGEITPDLMRRMSNYFIQAEATRADVIFSVCSTVGDVVDVARTMVSTPIVKIDDAMVREALSTGEKIGVLATLPSTLEPTCRLVEGLSKTEGKAVQINKGLVAGAFEVLISGNKTLHDQMVLSGLRELETKSDVVVLAQASMARVIEQTSGEFSTPILSSPRMGVRYLKQVLEGLP